MGYDSRQNLFSCFLKHFLNKNLFLRQNDNPINPSCQHSLPVVCNSLLESVRSANIAVLFGGF